MPAREPQPGPAPEAGRSKPTEPRVAGRKRDPSGYAKPNHGQGRQEAIQTPGWVRDLAATPERFMQARIPRIKRCTFRAHDRLAGLGHMLKIKAASLAVKTTHKQPITFQDDDSKNQPGETRRDRCSAGRNTICWAVMSIRTPRSLRANNIASSRDGSTSSETSCASSRS